MIDKSITTSIINMAGNISEIVDRLRCRDPTLKTIKLFDRRLTDDHVIELIDCLMNNPNIVTVIHLSANRLTDKTGVKLARYVAMSSTIRRVDLNHNQFGETTYLAIAAALSINTSLKDLYLYGKQSLNMKRIDSAFVDALIVNPDRPISEWWLYSWERSDFRRLKEQAEKLGHPSMQATLATQFI